MEITTLQSILAPFARKYGIELLVLFGSQATGKTHAKSDIDIGYIAPHSFNKQFLEAVSELSALLRRNDVELVNLRKISPLFKKIIADTGIVLYEKKTGIFIQFKMYTFKLYVETKPLRELRFESLKKFSYGKV